METDFASCPLSEYIVKDTVTFSGQALNQIRSNLISSNLISWIDAYAKTLIGTALFADRSSKCSTMPDSFFIETLWAML